MIGMTITRGNYRQIASCQVSDSFEFIHPELYSLDISTCSSLPLGPLLVTMPQLRRRESAEHQFFPAGNGLCELECASLSMVKKVKKGGHWNHWNI